jgi:hypothetical protein
MEIAADAVALEVTYDLLDISGQAETDTALKTE